MSAKIKTMKNLKKFNYTKHLNNIGSYKNLHVKKLDPSRLMLDLYLRWIYAGLVPNWGLLWPKPGSLVGLTSEPNELAVLTG